MSENELTPIPEEVAKSGEAARMVVKNLDVTAPAEAAASKPGDIDLSPAKPEPAAPVMSRSDGSDTADAKAQKEVERLRSELARKSGEYGANIQNLQAQIKEMQDRLATTTAAKQAAAPGKAEKPPASTSLPEEPSRTDLVPIFGEDYITNYGEDFAKTQYKAMRKLAEAGRLHGTGGEWLPAPEVEKVVTAKVQESLQRRDEQQAQEAFFAAVEKKAPGALKADAEWETNGWSDFLSQSDPATGINRRSLALMARDSGAVDTVARLYNEFLRPTSSARAPAPPPMEQQIAPPSEQVTPETKSSRPLVSRARFLEFSDAARMYPERFAPGQIQKVKDEYQRAASEGRLVA